MSSRGRGRGGGPSRRGRIQPEIGPDGKEINPYIPRYIANAPWYLEKSDDYLEHQRSHKDPNFKGEWYDRGKDSSKSGPIKFRKGACTNCGSMSHKASDCIERPRKVGAKYNGLDMKDDEEVKEIRTTWDSKRDRWNGFDAEEYRSVVAKYEEKEKLKQEKDNEEVELEKKKSEGKHEDKEPATDKKQKTTKDQYGLDSLNSDDDDDDSDLDSKTKSGPAIRTLRVKEEKARYLQDLSEDAAVFNPKSRTLRSEEDGVINERGQFIRRLTGKAEEHSRYRKLADEAAENGGTIHMEKGPTASLLKFKELEKARRQEDEKLRSSLLDKYGGQEYLDKNRPQEVDEAPNDKYIEYTETGEIIKKNSAEKEESVDQDKETEKSESIAKSKYEEDVYPGNHTSIWGSYWKDSKWGYACCHSLLKQSYCTGAKGREINDQTKNGKFLGKAPIIDKRKPENDSDLEEEEEELKKRRR